MEKFRLGQEVVIGGKFVKKGIPGFEVEKAKMEIRETGISVTSHKYDVENFAEPKAGIVVGIRSIVCSRLHYLDTTASGGKFVDTKTIRQPAVIVATDLRGLYYVPMSLVQDYEEWEFEELEESLE